MNWLGVRLDGLRGLLMSWCNGTSVLGLMNMCCALGPTLSTLYQGSPLDGGQPYEVMLSRLMVAGKHRKHAGWEGSSSDTGGNSPLEQLNSHIPLLGLLEIRQHHFIDRADKIRALQKFVQGSLVPLIRFYSLFMWRYVLDWPQAITEQTRETWALTW